MDLTPKNGRGKTMKRRTEPLTSVNEMDPALVSFLTTESATALKRPWLRLDRGVRMQKFRAFAEASPEMTTPAEKDILYRALVAANDAKLLNSKQQVVYDSEKGDILDIKGLRISRIGDTPPTVKIEAARPTKKGSKVVEEA
jgi:hypothetical protein